jgi:hypothetical protein
MSNGGDPISEALSSAIHANPPFPQHFKGHGKLRADLTGFEHAQLISTIGSANPSVLVAHLCSRSRYHLGRQHIQRGEAPRKRIVRP